MLERARKCAPRKCAFEALEPATGVDPASEDEGDEEAAATDETAIESEPTNESDIAIVEDSIDVAPVADADEPGGADEVAAELIAEPAVETAATTEETDQPA